MASKKRKSNRKLTQTQKEMIVQTFAFTGNKSEVVRATGYSYPTVLKVIQEAESNKELQKARLSALEDVAGRVHGKTTDILDSIGPEDYEFGLIKKFNDDGELISAKSYGPSLMQKVTSAAILTDKLKVIEETKNAILSDGGDTSGAMPLPGDLQGALKMLGEKVKSLRILDVQFADNNPEAADKVQEVAHKASLNDNLEDADYEDLDFDNP